MGEVIQAEHIFLASKEAHIEAMQTEERLRDLASRAANFYAGGLVQLSNQIILDVDQKERDEFRTYLQESIKYHES